MVCACTKCNFFTTEELRSSLQILVTSIRSRNFDLHEVFVSFVTILKRTPLKIQTLKPADPDFSEDIHMQAYDSLGEIHSFLKLLREVVQSMYRTSWFALMRVEYIQYLYFIQEYIREVWREFFFDTPVDCIPGMPGHKMKELNEEINSMVNMFAEIMKHSGTVSGKY